MTKEVKKTELEEAKQEYEDLFKEKAPRGFTAKDIREYIADANEQFEKDFP